MTGFRIVKATLPSEQVIANANITPDPLYEGSFWWFEHMAGQMERSSSIRDELIKDREKAHEEAIKFFGRIISGDLTREIEERHAALCEPETEVSAPSPEELLSVFQTQMLRDRMATTMIDAALTSGNRQQLSAIKSDPRLAQLSEKIQPSGQGNKAMDQKEYDVSTLWANLLAQALMIQGKPSDAARVAKRTARSTGQLLGVPLLDVAIRKSARNLAGTLSIPTAELERDLINMVRDSTEFRQNFASVVRLLRDMTDEPWTVCAACGESNDPPWDKCIACGVEKGDTVRQ